MPTFTEIMSTRLGGSIGLFGGQGLTTTWYASLDDSSDNPVEEFTTPGNGGVVIGEPHPWAPFGVVAQAVSVRERHAPDRYYLDVIYGTQLSVPDVGWTVRFSGATRTQKVDSLIKRNSKGDIVRTDDGVIVREPIGPRQYVRKDWYNKQPEGSRPSVDTSVTYRAIVDNLGIKKPVELYRYTGENDRRAQGITIPVPVGQISYAATTTVLQRGAMGRAWNFINQLNESTWGGFPAGTVRCANVELEERLGQVEGQPVSGFVYDVNITFDVNLDGHQPVILLDTYSGDDGNNIPVIRGEGSRREAQYSEYFYARSVDFDDLLSIFIIPRIPDRGGTKR